jgi:hypothetical protein
MPVFYNENEDDICQQNGHPNFGNNANFRNYREPNRQNSDTEASSTGHHIGDLYRRHQMNQADAQNDAQHNWFQDTREQLNRKQGNSVFDQVNKINKTLTRIVTNNLKVPGIKTSNITEMLHPKIWEHPYIP